MGTIEVGRENSSAIDLYVEIDGGPHVQCVTHAAEINRELLSFLADPTRATDGAA